jgi:hypothetical protein
MPTYFNEPKCKMFQCICGFFTIHSEAMDKHNLEVHGQTGVFDFEC